MASVVDLNGIKDTIQLNLLNANTTTASPVYLSNNLTSKISRVLKTNPNLIPMQASFYPLVTCYVTGKRVESADMSIDQLNAKMKCTIDIEVVGAIWNQNFVNDDEDPADEDINYLMENVELVLRNDYNLSGKVTWQRTTGIEYYITPLDEQTHLRFGVLKLECLKYY